MYNNLVRVNVRKYLFGGWSRFTIVQYNADGSQIREDYELKLNEKHRNMYFVYTRDLYERKMYYHGFVKDYESGLKYERAKTLKLRSDEYYNEKAVKAFMWVLERANSLPERVKIYHDGTCAKCGRQLLDEDPDGTGFCYTCRSKMR